MLNLKHLQNMTLAAATVAASASLTSHLQADEGERGRRPEFSQRDGDRPGPRPDAGGEERDA
ncbi:MAG: hypothetical protein ACO3FE_22820, partial [Planctomycetaceae bacterium]